jgi:pimeloyl-ACP methyl ester carboxylesterase
MITLLVGAAALAVQVASPQGYPGWVYDEGHTIATVDGRELSFFVDRPETGQPAPLLLMVDGSSCVGQLRPGWRGLCRPGPDQPAPFARLMVEKPGVEPDADHGAECSQEYLRHYTIDNRVFDHLRVLQHLRADADWWNGELLIWGWSDGGDIASQIVAYYPDVTRAVLGAMGGGYTMAEHFENFWICPADQIPDADERASCIEDLRSLFQQMADNPTWQETWSGSDNSWRLWTTRLDSRLVHVLEDNTTPILIVHGADDYDATPVASARVLVEALEAANNTHFEYWEIPCMGHGWGSLPATQGSAVEAGMLDWLLGQPVAEDGPPRFAQPEGTPCAVAAPG